MEQAVRRCAAELNASISYSGQPAHSYIYNLFELICSGFIKENPWVSKAVGEATHAQAQEREFKVVRDIQSGKPLNCTQV